MAFGEFALCRVLLTASVLNMMVVIDASYLLRPAERISGTCFVFGCQENLWKAWRPLQRLVVATENRSEDGLKNFAKVCKEGNVVPLDVSQGHRTRHQQCCIPLLLPAGITCATLRLVLGLDADHCQEIIDYMASHKATLYGFNKLCRRLKDDRNWEYVYLHPENTIIRETRNMPALKSCP